MSQVDIVYLDSYRKRRESRFRRALALHGHEEERTEILRILQNAISLVGADRGAVVWLDEYGPGLAHPHTVLDLGADRPRRLYSPLPLRAAWDTRVPGLLDLPRTEGRWERLGEGISSACIVALGSDGPRSWFLCVDSLTPRPALNRRMIGELMFLAGEVAAVVLHRDLGLKERVPDFAPPSAVPEPGGDGSFSGWPILKDLDGRTRDKELSRRIQGRFLVARFVRGMVEDELVADADSLGHQVEGIREELGLLDCGDEERRSWDRILTAAVAADHWELMAAALEWGRVLDGLGHLNGAQEVLDLAYQLAKAMSAPDAAADAARFLGKVFRTQAEWDQAVAWYGIARRVTSETGNKRKLAAVVDGLANAHRDRGNLPRAFELLQDVLEIGRETGDRYVLAIAHHDLMTVQKLRGEFVPAIQHGWLAVQDYSSRDGRLRALFDLAGVLRETGELSAAWDAYSVVVDQVEGLEAQVLALDALAFVAAQKGDGVQHLVLRNRLDEVDWEDVSPVYKGQVLYFRGLSHRALGEEEMGREWLGKALVFAEEHGLSKLIFDAEAALKDEAAPPALVTPAPLFQDSPPEEILGIRRGLREMNGARAGLGEFP